jgi:hypothetical protein
MNNKQTIGILYICTGSYVIFWKDFYLSMEKHFIPEAEKHYFVFTDSPEIAYEHDNKNIHRVHQDNLGWPGNTLRRFEIFLNSKEQFANMDYLFFFNANLVVKETISAHDFLPDNTQRLMACHSPGFYNKSADYVPYERNPASTAYIPFGQGQYYFAGGLNGGITADFIAAMEAMDQATREDTKNDIVAVHHDESHWNKYLLNKKGIKILPVSYLYPEGWGIPFHPIILIRDKFKFNNGTSRKTLIQKFFGHYTLRGQKMQIVKRFFFLSTRIPAALKRRIGTLLYPYRLGKKFGDKQSQKDLLLISIAFNNAETIQLQYEYLKKNLSDNFSYTVADNSNDKKASIAIRSFCIENNIPYYKLPSNPLTGAQPSGSHGLALNWSYKHIVKKTSQKFFGFLDHDIFPFRETAIIPHIRQGMFGWLQERNDKWYLWPGFCFYEYEKVKNISLNFMPATNLDTGGSNYEVLYKNTDRGNLVQLQHGYVNIETNEESTIFKDAENTVELIGDWIHIMRVSSWNGHDKNTLPLRMIVEKFYKSL